jgi:hypothetical protein
MSIKRNMAHVVMVFSLVLMSRNSAKADESRNQAARASISSHIARDPVTSPSLLADDIASQLANLPRPAPVGHRQPRAADVHPDAEPAPDEVTLQRENSMVDRKLVICRRC